MRHMHVLISLASVFSYSAHAGAQTCSELYAAEEAVYNANNELNSFNYAVKVDEAWQQRNLCYSNSNIPGYSPGNTDYYQWCDQEYNETMSTIESEYNLLSLDFGWKVDELNRLAAILGGQCS